MRIVLSDSEPNLDDGSDESTDLANTTKRCPSHLGSGTKPGSSDTSSNFSYDDIHGASGESHDDTPSVTSNRDPSRRNATTRSDNAAPSQIGGSKTVKRKADMGGIDPHNIINPSPRAPNESDRSQSDNGRPRKSQRLMRGYGESTVSYDTKHHPMDDILWPKYSAKSRGNRKQVAEESSDSDGEIGKDIAVEAPSKKMTSPNPHCRRSSRGIHLSKRPIYSAKWHPLDQMLKDNASSTRVSKGGDRSRSVCKSSESSSTLKDEEESFTISFDDPNHDGDEASELEGRITPISPSQRRSARVSSSRNGPPNYDMKYGHLVRT